MRHSVLEKGRNVQYIRVLLRVYVTSQVLILWHLLSFHPLQIHSHRHSLFSDKCLGILQWFSLVLMKSRYRRTLQNYIQKTTLGIVECAPLCGIAPTTISHHENQTAVLQHSTGDNEIAIKFNFCSVADWHKTPIRPRSNGAQNNKVTLICWGHFSDCLAR